MTQRRLSSLSLNQKLTLLIAFLAVLGTIIAAFFSGHDWFQPLPKSGINSITPTISQNNNLDGVWIGETSTGGTIYFEVIDNIVYFRDIEFSTTVKFGKAYCPSSGGFGSQRAYIENNSFFQVVKTTYLDIQIKGTFESILVASGSISPPEPPLANTDCDVTFVTWKALRK
jgi:hypothetical protein